MNTKICFIRHAESESNAGGRTSDPATILLSKQGIAQAEALALTLSNKPSLVVTSRYIRTKQTALPVIKKFKDVSHEEWDIHEFTYLSPVKCENTNSSDRLSMVREYWEKCDPSYSDGVGAESFVDLISRANQTIKKLRLLDNRNIMIFSHEQFIKAVLWLIASDRNPLDSKNMKSFRQVLLTDRISNCGKVEISL
jgi:2,3-bisphosphoglycerate-dependent phosphoglycerate mutase